MKVLIFGGTGFIGRALTRALIDEGAQIFISTRRPEKHQSSPAIQYLGPQVDVKTLPTMDLVINLAGESLFGYWTKGKKEEILRSRIQTTKHVIQLMGEMEEKPRLFINASAIGYYGPSDDIIFTEETQRAGEDFLASVVSAWEEVACEAEGLGIPTLLPRFGLVLGQAGSLPLMSLPVKLGLGGQIGSGQQYMSWIHIDDLTRAIIFLIDQDVSGPVNFTAPKPEQNKYFIKTMARSLNRPSLLPLPAFLIEKLLGEMSLLVTQGQYVLPKRLLEAGYNFKYKNLEDALENLFN